MTRTSSAGGGGGGGAGVIRVSGDLNLEVGALVTPDATN